MPKSLKNLTTEDVKTEELDIDILQVSPVTIPANPAAVAPEEEVRYYPLLDGRYTAAEAEKLLAAKQAETL